MVIKQINYYKLRDIILTNHEFQKHVQMNVRNERKQKVFGQLFQRNERCEGPVIKVSYGINVIRGSQRKSG